MPSGTSGDKRRKKERGKSGRGRGKRIDRAGTQSRRERSIRTYVHTCTRRHVITEVTCALAGSSFAHAARSPLGHHHRTYADTTRLTYCKPLPVKFHLSMSRMMFAGNKHRNVDERGRLSSSTFIGTTFDVEFCRQSGSENTQSRYFENERANRFAAVRRVKLPFCLPTRTIVSGQYCFLLSPRRLVR